MLLRVIHASHTTALIINCTGFYPRQNNRQYCRSKQENLISAKRFKVDAKIGRCR